MRARHLTIDAACQAVFRLRYLRVPSFAAFSSADFPLSSGGLEDPAVPVCPRLLA
jgi:hypothetical protein